MYQLVVTTWIKAPAAVCFDLARSVDAHLQSAAKTSERVISGPTNGLLDLGVEVTWEANHLGITQRLTSRITLFEPPTYFRDQMTRGAFRTFEHDHHFEPQNGGTLMKDVLRFAAPLGPLGWLAERLFLARHLRRFLTDRGIVLKQLAECRAIH